jgi:hypothetical protein
MTDSMWLFTQWEHFWIEYFLAGLLAFYAIDIIWTQIRNFIQEAAYGR